MISVLRNVYLDKRYNVNIDLYNFKISKYLIESNFLYETYKYFYFRAFMFKRFIKSPKIPSIEQILIFAGLKR